MDFYGNPTELMTYDFAMSNWDFYIATTGFVEVHSDSQLPPCHLCIRCTAGLPDC